MPRQAQPETGVSFSLDVNDRGFPVTNSRKSAVPAAKQTPLLGRRPVRATRRPVRYNFDALVEDGSLFDDDEVTHRAHRDEGQHGDSDKSTDSEAEEDARIERSMGVIRKNAASRGTEGGTKYHCDVCSIDITSTVRSYTQR